MNDFKRIAMSARTWIERFEREPGRFAQAVSQGQIYDLYRLVADLAEAMEQCSSNGQKCGLRVDPDAQSSEKLTRQGNWSHW